MKNLLWFNVTLEYTYNNARQQPKKARRHGPLRLALSLEIEKAHVFYLKKNPPCSQLRLRTDQLLSLWNAMVSRDHLLQWFLTFLANYPF